MDCAACGFGLPEESRFCAACGAPGRGALGLVSILPSAVAGAAGGFVAVAIASAIPVEDSVGFWATVWYFIVSTTLPYAPEAFGLVAGWTAVATLPLPKGGQSARPTATGLQTAGLCGVLYVGGLTLAPIMAGAQWDGVRVLIALGLVLVGGALAMWFAAVVGEATGATRVLEWAPLTRYVAAPVVALLVVTFALVVYGLVVTAIAVLLVLLAVTLGLWLLDAMMHDGHPRWFRMAASEQRSTRSKPPTPRDWGGDEPPEPVIRYPVGYIEKRTRYDAAGREAGYSRVIGDGDGSFTIDHYDLGGRRVGRSHRRPVDDGPSSPVKWEVEHFDALNKPQGRSIERERWGRPWQDHFDTSGKQVGHGRGQEDSLGNTRWEHYDNVDNEKGSDDV